MLCSSLDYLVSINTGKRIRLVVAFIEEVFCSSMVLIVLGYKDFACAEGMGIEGEEGRSFYM